MTNHEIQLLYDYVKFFRNCATRTAQQAEGNPRLTPELKRAIVTEQTRRAKELKRLEAALGAEINAYNNKGVKPCRKDEGSQQTPATVPRAKRKGFATVKKSKKRGDGTCMPASSVKPANASSGKRKPGRPRKTAPTE